MSARDNDSNISATGPIVEIFLREDLMNPDARIEADMASRIFDNTIRRFETAEVSHLLAVFVYAQNGGDGTSDQEVISMTLEAIRALSDAKREGLRCLGYAAMFDSDAQAYFADCDGDYRTLAYQELADELWSVIVPEVSTAMTRR